LFFPRIGSGVRRRPSFLNLGSCNALVVIDEKAVSIILDRRTALTIIAGRNPIITHRERMALITVKERLALCRSQVILVVQ
jgi:hypothetical protein